jgi:hypothetical protein
VRAEATQALEEILERLLYTPITATPAQ